MLAHYIARRKQERVAPVKCDECAVELPREAAIIASDDTGEFPVCECCHVRFFARAA